MSAAPRIVLASVGRFHYGELAAALHQRGLLTRFYSGFTRDRMRAPGVPADQLDSWPWVQMPVGFLERYGLLRGRPLRALTTRSQAALDRHIARTLPEGDVFAALSGCAVAAGAEAHRRGMRVVCERGSEHIRVAEQRIAAEFARWGIPHLGTDPRMIDREEREYARADRILVLSEVARDSFLEAGVAAEKLRIAAPDFNTVFTRQSIQPRSPDRHALRLLFVGSQSVIKGFGHLLRAFADAAIPGARLRLIGQRLPETRALRPPAPDHRVDDLGHRPPAEVAAAMRDADALIVPSITDGLPSVVYEALLSGCPVVCSDRAGASTHIHHEVNGLIVPAGDSDALAAALRRLHDEPDLLDRLRAGVDRLGPLWQRGGDYAQRWLAAIA